MARDKLRIRSDFCDLFSYYELILVFDVETTGLDAFTDEVIEITLVELMKENDDIAIKEVEDFYINLPDRRLPETIVKLTGITDDLLIETGQPRSDIAKKIAGRINSGKTLLIAHNANFDMNFLLAMLQKEKCSIDLDRIDVIDTLTIYKDRHPYPHKLSNAVETYGLASNVRNSHRSIDDAIATLYVFDALCIERNDIRNYINLFGVNPKYGLKQRDKIKTIRYCDQPYSSKHKLYELANMPAGGCK